MDLTDALRAMADTVAAATGPVVAVGARTQFETGNPVLPAAEMITAPSGVVRFEPADLTVTVGAGTTCAALDAVLAPAGQEVALDPRDPHATIGGVLAVGTSGPRRLGHGPLRETVLEVRSVTATGRVVKGGGPTVKNVSGYDLPRLLVGSFGTLGLLGQVTLRCRARPRHAQWATRPGPPGTVRSVLARPSSVLWDGVTTTVLLEGHLDDVELEMQRADLTPAVRGPALPGGPHRGRISVRPAAIEAVAPGLEAAGCRWLAEGGVGTVHVAGDTSAQLAAARTAAHAAGGWLLRESGAPDLDGFGPALANVELLRRVKAAFDPDDKLAPGRLPLAPMVVTA